MGSDIEDSGSEGSPIEELDNEVEYFPEGEEDERPHKKRKITSLPLSDFDEFEKEARRRGIIYISRLPPNMKPHQLRLYLRSYGDIKRIYCTPEGHYFLHCLFLIHADITRTKERGKKGGNKRRQFTESWVEFSRKKHAKVENSETLSTLIIECCTCIKRKAYGREK